LQVPEKQFFFVLLQLPVFEGRQTLYYVARKTSLNIRPYF
jgi:hypothetical protein